MCFVVAISHVNVYTDLNVCRKAYEKCVNLTAAFLFDTGGKKEKK